MARGDKFPAYISYKVFIENRYSFLYIPPPLQFRANMFYVFGYGSLMLRPGFDHVGHVDGYVDGYKRCVYRTW